MTAAPSDRDDLSTRLVECEGVLFDIDGCLALFGARPEDAIALPGAADAVRLARESGRSVLAFTNASAKSPAAIAETLCELGITVGADEVLTPAIVAAEVATHRYAPRPVMPFGGPALVDVLRDADVALLDEDDEPSLAAAVVVGWDTAIEGRRLQRAAEALWAGADLLVTSDARSFASQGRPTAGVSGFIAHGLMHVSGTPLEILGKPSSTAMAMAARRLGVAPERMLVVGDDLTLEIAMGLSVGAVAVLTTTGTHAAADAEKVPPERQPDLVVDGLPELLAAWPGIAVEGAA